MLRPSGIPFALRRPDGLVIRGVHFPAHAPGRRPAVILSHGFNGCFADLLNRGRDFASAGIHCFLFDFCGGGLRTTSGGKLSDMMTLETEITDLQTVIARVQTQEDVDTSNIFLMGESQGGMVSILTAERLPSACRGLILWFPALVIPEDSRRRLANGDHRVFGIPLCPDYDRIAAKVDPWSFMPTFENPVLLVHGDRDPLIPVPYLERAQRLFPDATLRILQGAGHGFGRRDYRLAMADTLAMIRKAAAI